MAKVIAYHHKVVVIENEGGSWRSEVTTLKRTGGDETVLDSVKTEHLPGTFPSAQAAEDAGWAFTREAFRGW